jgi:hypothetical protein
VIDTSANLDSVHLVYLGDRAATYLGESWAPGERRIVARPKAESMARTFPDVFVVQSREPRVHTRGLAPWR